VSSSRESAAWTTPTATPPHRQQAALLARDRRLGGAIGQGSRGARRAALSDVTEPYAYLIETVDEHDRNLMERRARDLGVDQFFGVGIQLNSSSGNARWPTSRPAPPPVWPCCRIPAMMVAAV